MVSLGKGKCFEFQISFSSDQCYISVAQRKMASFRDPRKVYPMIISVNTFPSAAIKDAEVNRAVQTLKVMIFMLFLVTIPPIGNFHIKSKEVGGWIY